MVDQVHWNGTQAESYELVNAIASIRRMFSIPSRQGLLG